MGPRSQGGGAEQVETWARGGPRRGNGEPDGGRAVWWAGKWSPEEHGVAALLPWGAGFPGGR